MEAVNDALKLISKALECLPNYGIDDNDEPHILLKEAIDKLALGST